MDFSKETSELFCVTNKKTLLWIFLCVGEDVTTFDIVTDPKVSRELSLVLIWVLPIPVSLSWRGSRPKLLKTQREAELHHQWLHSPKVGAPSSRFNNFLFINFEYFISYCPLFQMENAL